MFVTPKPSLQPTITQIKGGTEMRAFICVTIAILLAFVGVVGAIPTTLATTDIGNNNFTLNCNGAVGSTHFQYGYDPQFLNIWTIALTPDAGAVSSVEYGSPIMPSKHYYAVACDSTGCEAPSNLIRWH
jgi:hypothetical protein